MHKFYPADSMFPKEWRNYIEVNRVLCRLIDVNQQEALKIKSTQKIGNARIGKLKLAELPQTRLLIGAFLLSVHYEAYK